MSRTGRNSKKTNGTDDVLANLGDEDTEGGSVKAPLARKLNELIDKRGLSQKKAAIITGMRPTKMSQLRRYKLKTLSLEQLMQALTTLDHHVEIVVQPARRSGTASITVVA